MECLKCIDFPLLFLGAAGLILTISLQSSVVKEYALALEYEETECHVTDIRRRSIERCQFCTSTSDSSRRRNTRRCRDSYFPCYDVQVWYYDDFRRNQTAQLHSDALQLDGEFKKCSYFVCRRTLELSTDEVTFWLDQYQNDMSMQQSSKCYYKKDKPRSVLAAKIYGANSVLHAKLWPSILLVVGFGGFLIHKAVQFCNCENPFKSTPSSSSSTAAYSPPASAGPSNSPHDGSESERILTNSGFAAPSQVPLGFDEHAPPSYNSLDPPSKEMQAFPSAPPPSYYDVDK